MVSRKVCVVGAGVIGLSSAVRIQNTLPDVDVTLIMNYEKMYCNLYLDEVIA
jgi:protoporphyrinogen oxidase